MTKLSRSIEQYIDIHKEYPPRVTRTGENEVDASWRVLLESETNDAILPYDFKSPWDSAINQEFARQPTYVKYCIVDENTEERIPRTRIIALVSPDSIVGAEHRCVPTDVLDGLENTLLFAEIPRSKIPWTEPRDMRLEELESCCSTHTSPELVGYEDQYLLFADREFYRVKRPMPKEIFRALWTRSASDGKTRNQLVEEGYLAR